MVKYILLDDDEPDKGGNGSPGARLRAAREELNLDIKTVAKKLHMNEKSIIALENDDYEKFPAPIYVSGFLRNYARLLNVEPGPIVDSFESLGKEVPPILSDLTASIPRRRHKGIESWAGYLAGGGILLMLLVWMLPSNNQSFDHNVQTQAENPLKSVPAPAPAVPDVQAFTGENESSNVSEVDAGSPVPETPLPIPSDTLVLDFTGDSWVEITDSTGRRVFYSMGKTGETSTILGIAPFNILLGYSPGVSIEYNGKPFDQSPYERQDVARFKLGKRN